MIKTLAAVVGTCLLLAPSIGSASEFNRICLQQILGPLPDGEAVWYALGYFDPNCLDVPPLPTWVAAPVGAGPDYSCDECLEPNAPVPTALRAPETEAASERSNPFNVPVGPDFDYYKRLNDIDGPHKPRKPHPLSMRRLFILPRLDGKGVVHAFLFPVTIDVKRPGGEGGELVAGQDQIAIGFETTPAPGVVEVVKRDDVLRASAYIDGNGNHVEKPQSSAYYRFMYNDNVCDAIVFLASPDGDAE